MQVTSVTRMRKPTLEVLAAGGVLPAAPTGFARFGHRRLDVQLQCFAAVLSALIYEYAPEPLARILEHEGAGRVSSFGGLENGMSALGFVLQGRAWIVFCGTNEGRDWDRNFQFSMSNNTHGGFLWGWTELKAEVEPWVERLDGAAERLAFAGHSLGGALAILGAEVIAGTSPIPIEGVFTFGAPGVGNAHYSNRYAEAMTPAGSPDAVPLADVTWQLRNAADFVPRVGAGITDFKHCGKAGAELWGGPEPTAQLRDSVDDETFETLGDAAALPANLGKKGEFDLDSCPPPAPNPWRQAFDSVGKMFIPLMYYYVKAVALGLERARGAKRAHSMALYQSWFGRYLSFSRAIFRNQEYLDEVFPKGETERVQTNRFGEPMWHDVVRAAEGGEGLTYGLDRAPRPLVDPSKSRAVMTLCVVGAVVAIAVFVLLGYWTVKSLFFRGA